MVITFVWLFYLLWFGLGVGVYLSVLFVCFVWLCLFGLFGGLGLCGCCFVGYALCLIVIVYA